MKYLEENKIREQKPNAQNDMAMKENEFQGSIQFIHETMIKIYNDMDIRGYITDKEIRIFKSGTVNFCGIKKHLSEVQRDKQYEGLKIKRRKELLIEDLKKALFKEEKSEFD